MKLSSIQRFWRLLSPYQKTINQIYLYAVLNGIVNLSLPIGIQAIVLFIQGGEITTSWMVLVAFVLLGMATTGFFQIRQLRLVEEIQQDVFARSSFEFAYRIPKIKLLKLDQIHAPELANRFFDTLTIQKGLPKILIDFSLAAFQIIFGMLLLAIYSPYFIILAFFLFILVWIMLRITGPVGMETSLKESKYKYKLAHWLEEIARTNKNFKVNAYQKHHLQKTDEIASHYIESREKHFKVLIKQFSHFIGFKITIAAGLLILGSLLVIQGQMNIGQFIASEIVIILIISSVEKVIQVIETIYDVLTALEKIGFVTDLELEDRESTNTINKKTGMDIEIVNVGFTYPDASQAAFEKLSLNIPSGSKIQITGESGSGKSTLLHLIAGLYDLTSGQIFINKVPLSNLNKEDYFSNIGIYLSSEHLFEGSIRDNICMGREIHDQELNEIIKTLHLDEFTSLLPKGIDTIIDPAGRRLPRGAIQKISIARAIIDKPKLLLMEDPLSFVNEEDKKLIIDYLLDKKHSWTVIVVAAHPHWAQRCGKQIDIEELCSS